MPNPIPAGARMDSDYGYSPMDVAEMLLQHPEGYSVDSNGHVPTSGYMCALKPYELVLEALQEPEVYEWVWKHWPTVGSKFFGIWTSSETGEVHLNISETWHNRQIAEASARANDQLSIYDITCHKEIEVRS